MYIHICIYIHYIRYISMHKNTYIYIYIYTYTRNYAPAIASTPFHPGCLGNTLGIPRGFWVSYPHMMGLDTQVMVLNRISRFLHDCLCFCIFLVALKLEQKDLMHWGSPGSPGTSTNPRGSLCLCNHYLKASQTPWCPNGGKQVSPMHRLRKLIYICI